MSECGDGVLELYIGDDWSIPFTLKRRNSGDPFNLTGVTEISFKFKNADGTLLTKLLSTYTSGNGVTVTAAASGKGLIEVPRAETALIKANTLVSHSMVVTLSGKETTASFKKNISILSR